MEVRDRILIIEDDRSIRKFFRTILEANRYDVISADTGEEGYSLLTSQCPDLVILDLGLIWMAWKFCADFENGRACRLS